VISLSRSAERRRHIASELAARGIPFEFVNAIDGRAIRPDQRGALVDKQSVSMYPKWLSDTAIGCALSHRLAYERLLASGERCALVLEDDVLLANDLPPLLEQLQQIIAADEVIQLNFRSFEPCKLSRTGAVSLGRYQLLRPVESRQVLSSAGYLIGATAAARLYRALVPVRVAADSWGDQLERGNLGSLRCVLPRPVQHAKFESTLGYAELSLLTAKLKACRHWPVSMLRNLNRQRTARQMTRIKLVD
jgi:glycosyl transferase family 25